MSDFIPSVKDYLQICCDANSRAWKGRFCARTAGWFFVSQKAQFTHGVVSGVSLYLPEKGGSSAI